MIPVHLDLMDFFYLLIYGGLCAVVVVMIPVQIASKLRRIRRRRTHRICRVCGHRFLRPADNSLMACPHCGVMNK